MLAGELANLVSASSHLPVEHQCITKMLDGERDLPEDLQDLPNPFVFSEHFDILCQGLDPAEPKPKREGKQMLDWLPDVADAQVGMPLKVNAYQVRCSQPLPVIRLHIILLT